MFEKEAEEYSNNWKINKNNDLNFAELVELRAVIYKANKDGAEFGYNKSKDDVKHDLMMKLKDEGIVKPLKDSVLRNERLSSQEQQELCAWIECAMDFGENLDECAKELEEAKKVNEWHYPSKGELPEKTGRYLILNRFGEHYFTTNITEYLEGAKMFSRFSMKDVYAWKEIV